MLLSDVGDTMRHGKNFFFKAFATIIVGSIPIVGLMKMSRHSGLVEASMAEYQASAGRELFLNRPWSQESQTTKQMGQFKRAAYQQDQQRRSVHAEI